MILPIEEVPANYVPAAAVIHRGRALFGFTGHKACVGGFVSWMLKPSAQLKFAFKTTSLEFGRGKRNL